MALWRMIMKEIGGRFQNAAGAIDSDKNMYYGAKGCAPSDKLGKMGSISGGGAGLSTDNLVGGAGAGGMGAGDASSGVDFSSMGEAASTMA